MHLKVLRTIAIVGHLLAAAALAGNTARQPEHSGNLQLVDGGKSITVKVDHYGVAIIAMARDKKTRLVEPKGSKYLAHYLQTKQPTDSYWKELEPGPLLEKLDGLFSYSELQVRLVFISGEKSDTSDRSTSFTDRVDSISDAWKQYPPDIFQYTYRHATTPGPVKVKINETNHVLINGRYWPRWEAARPEPK